MMVVPQLVHEYSVLSAAAQHNRMAPLAGICEPACPGFISAACNNKLSWYSGCEGRPTMTSGTQSHSPALYSSGLISGYYYN